MDARTAPVIEAHQRRLLVLDLPGFFTVSPKKDESRVYLGHYQTDGTEEEVIYGEDPLAIASTAIERALVSRLDHAVYL